MLMVRAVSALIAAVILAQVPLAQAGDGCRYGYVWREAFQGDHVCVTPDIRARAAYDNAAAASRVNLYNHDYGPDTCQGGYVWREAQPSDHVCVTPDNRTQARHDNAAAPYRYADGPGRAYGARPAHVVETGCCPNSMLVCPLGRHFCR